MDLQTSWLELLPALQRRAVFDTKVIPYAFVICICGLPDMYALSPQVCGSRALGIHIRQATYAHDITITCT